MYVRVFDVFCFSIIMMCAVTAHNDGTPSVWPFAVDHVEFQSLVYLLAQVLVSLVVAQDHIHHFYNRHVAAVCVEFEQHTVTKRESQLSSSVVNQKHKNHHERKKNRLVGNEKYSRALGKQSHIHRIRKIHPPSIVVRFGALSSFL